MALRIVFQGKIETGNIDLYLKVAEVSILDSQIDILKLYNVFNMLVKNSNSNIVAMDLEPRANDALLEIASDPRKFLNSDLYDTQHMPHYYDLITDLAKLVGICNRYPALSVSYHMKD